MTCPICKKPTARDHRPFCSRRCADIDLGKWFDESYRVPSEEAAEAAGAAEATDFETKNPH